MHSTQQGHDLAPWSFAEPWGGIGHLTDLGGPVHWVDFGGPADGTPIVLVHGLGGSHLNWVRWPQPSPSALASSPSTCRDSA